MRVLIATAFENSKDPFELLALGYMKRTQKLFKPELKQVKADKLLDITQGYFRIFLDEKGQEVDSVFLSKKMQSWIDQAKPIAFLIGPPDGHSEQVKQAADFTLSLSKLTLPHKLALCVLAEQIYRAGEIARNGPYHRQ